MSRRRTFGNLEKRKGRPGLYVRFRLGGRRIRRVGGMTKAAARRSLSEVKVRIDRGYSLETILAEVFGEENGYKMTFRQAVADYRSHARSRKRASTLATDEYRFRVLCQASWSGRFLSEIRPADLERWSAERLAAGTAGSTINRDLSLASSLFRWAARLGYATTNPVTQVEKHSERGRARRVFLTPEEVRALVECAEPALRPILLTAVLTGMRRGELIALRWKSVDFASRLIIVEAETAKTARTRAIPVTRDLEYELEALRRFRRGDVRDGLDFVVVRSDGCPMTADALRRLFKRALDRCGAIAPEKRGKITFHTLRHTCASLLQKAGVSLFEIGRILGHSSTQTTLRYANLFADETRDAVDRLASVVNLRPADAEPPTGRVG